jgi:asparagine synthase (glutamine-hydrolysing)
MCGIAGIFGSSMPAIAAAMSAAIAHRGPDDEGLFADAAEGIALAHRRLSIIDVSACGHQPMSYAGGRYTIVFNGEIYNFAKIRHELENLGHRFVSHSDTEVVLAAYAEWGEKSVQRLRGMFAFAIYDREAQSPGDTALFLARDRFGIKPLYVTVRDSTLLFASELKALLASGLVPRRLDVEALWFYLSLGSVPQPRTILAGVEMLQPGHIMNVRRDRSIETKRYWDLAEAADAWRDDARGLDAQSAPARLRELLEEATRLHMIADVPVGAFLSGGIDSTAVVGLMTRASGQRIRTFSVGFAGDDTVADEREWARLAARRFDSEHTEIVVSGHEVAAQFDDLVAAIDQPSLDGTNTYLVSQAASRELKVALSGLGGDELFAGYPHFRRLQRAARWDRRLGPMHDLVQHVPGRFLHDRDFLASTPEGRYASLRSLAAGESKLSMLNGDVGARVTGTSMEKLYEPLLSDKRSSIAQTTYVETKRYLVDTLLRDADAMSMACSLEVRPVLLDHRLAEFAFALPDRLKVGVVNKQVFVDAVRDVLPPELLTRKKTGFELPLQSWLSGPLRERALAAFSSATARSLFSHAFIAATLEDLRQRQRPLIRIWAYLMLIEWCGAYGIEI